MNPTRGSRRWLPGPLLLIAAAAWLAISASGCIIDGSSSCSPDLFVNWEIVENGSNAILTCDQVPADTIRVNVSGAVQNVACPVGISTGSIPFALPVTDTYYVQVTLLGGGNVLSQTGNNPIFGDCNGTDTPLIPLVVF
jgi:hypothetical protein